VHQVGNQCIVSLVKWLVARISRKSAADAAAPVTDPPASRALSSLQCTCILQKVVLLANVGILTLVVCFWL